MYDMIDDSEVAKEVEFPVLPFYFGQSKAGVLAAAVFIAEKFPENLWEDDVLLTMAKTESKTADAKNKADKLALKAAREQAKLDKTPPLPEYERQEIKFFHAGMVEFQDLAVLSSDNSHYREIILIADHHERGDGVKKGTLLMKVKAGKLVPELKSSAKKAFATNALKCFGYNYWAGQQVTGGKDFAIGDASPFTVANRTHIDAFIQWRVKNLGFPSNIGWNGVIDDWDAPPFSLVISIDHYSDEDVLPSTSKKQKVAEVVTGPTKKVVTGRKVRTIKPIVTD